MRDTSSSRSPTPSRPEVFSQETVESLAFRKRPAALTPSGSALMMYLRVDTSGDAMATKGMRIELMVAKWGNSLAVRLPAESAKQIGVGEGDTLIAEISPDGRLVLAPEGRTIGKSEARRLRQFLGRQKETAPVVGNMRRTARY